MKVDVWLITESDELHTEPTATIQILKVNGHLNLPWPRKGISARASL